MPRAGRCRLRRLLPLKACPTGDLDTDGDGLPDCWEDGTWWADGLPGIALDGVYTPARLATATNRFTLCVDANANAVFEPGECADKLNRDVFVEIDYMEYHRPRSDSVSDVVNAFARTLPRSGRFQGSVMGRAARLASGCTFRSTSRSRTWTRPLCSPARGRKG